jgi:uncharacterized phage protein (TIGR02218 family)
MELYEFTIENKTYNFTSANEDINYNGTLYKAIPISRSEISYELEDTGAKIEVSIRETPFNKLIQFSTKKLASVKIYRYPEDILLFTGKIMKVEINYAKQKAILYLGHNYRFENAQIPKRTYSATCPWEFCSKECGLNIADYQFTLETSDFTLIDAKTIKSNKFQNLNFQLIGGYIKTNLDEFQFINSHNGDTIELLMPLIDTNISYILISGGCDKSINTCDSIYHNKKNFGGFPFIPHNNLTSDGF